MKTTKIRCLCGAIELQIDGEPFSQFYCHCDDCRAMTGAAYLGVAAFPASAVRVVRGKPATWTLKTMPRTHCSSCGTRLMAQPSADISGVCANLLPLGMFKPELHINCERAVLPVKDDLPHYKASPARFGGSDDTVNW